MASNNKNVIIIVLPSIVAILLYYTIRIHQLQYEQQTSIKMIIDSLDRRPNVDDNVDQTHRPLAWIYGENVCCNGNLCG